MSHAEEIEFLDGIRQAAIRRLEECEQEASLTEDLEGGKAAFGAAACIWLSTRTGRIRAFQHIPAIPVQFWLVAAAIPATCVP